MSENQSYKLIIEDDEGRRSVVPIELGEVSIGRQDSSTIRLNERNISRHHARMVRDGEAVVVEDLDSYNGVWVNGARIAQRTQVREGDIIRIGDFQLELRGEGLQRRTEETTQRTMRPEAEVTQPQFRLQQPEPAQPVAAPPPVAAPTPAPAPVVEEPDIPRHEPTAIIRLDQMAELEAQKRQAAAISGQKAKLICVSTQFAGQEFEVNKTEMVIGRTEDNDIPIDHRSVSRHHAKIVVSGSSYKVVDLKSANGTLVNGEEYAQTDLKPGDLLELGHVKFRFVPAGGSYELTADERAAVTSAGGATTSPGRRPSGVVRESPQEFMGATPQDGLPNLVARVTASPKLMIGLGVGIGALLILVLVVAFSGSKGPSTTPVATPTTPIAAPTPTTPTPDANSNPEIAKLMQKAQAAATQRHWKEAAALARAAQALAPGDMDAAALAEKAENEAVAQTGYESAVAAVGHGDWSAAWEALGNIPEGSVYAQQAGVLVDQVRNALITEAVRKADAAIEEKDFDSADDYVGEIAELDPQHAELTRLRDDIDQGRRRASKPARTAKATRTPPKTTKPPKTTPAPAATTSSSSPEDAKAYFAEGIKSLNGGQLPKAIDLFTKCVQADKRFANCYKALGITYARAKNGPKAAHYYELYLRTAPDAPDADKVRELLKNYKDRSN